MKWLTKNREILVQKAEQLLLLSNSKESALKFADAWEVVQWYSAFISVKIHRVHFDLDERLKDKEDEYNIFSDNQGSVKIALIAIDRTVAALSAMYTVMPDKEDEFLDFLALLSQIKKNMLKAFPGFMAFKRPGFDDWQ